MEKVIRSHKAQFSTVMQDFKAKIGIKNEGETLERHFGVCIRNSRGVIELSSINKTT